MMGRQSESRQLEWHRLTHWGRVRHICVSKLTIIGSDNGLSPGRGQAIIWTNAGILLIRPLETNFSEILIEFLTFSFKKMCLKVLSAKRWPFCLSLNVCNIVSPRQNGCHVVADTNELSWMKIVVFSFTFNQNLFPKIQFKIIQY